MTGEVVREPTIAGLDEAVGQIKRVLKLPSEKDYLAALIWAAQCHLKDLLQSVFYVAFTGPTGSGKGTGVECCILLSQRGLLAGSITDAALADALNEGMDIGIEEADSVLQGRGLLAALLRDGYTRRGSRLKMIPVGERAWESAKLDLFGPKVFDFHATLETHLRNRTYVIEMQPDNSVYRAMNAERKADFLEPVRAWLSVESEKAKKGWTKEKVKEHWDSFDFRQRVKGMGTRAGRDHVIAAIMLLISDLMGWRLDDQIREIMASRKPADEWSDIVEVADCILGLYKTAALVNGELTTHAVLGEVNDRRRELSLPPMSFQKLGGILKDIGFDKGKGTYRQSWATANRGRWCILPGPMMPRLLHLLQLEHETEAKATDATDNTDTPEKG